MTGKDYVTSYNIKALDNEDCKKLERFIIDNLNKGSGSVLESKLFYDGKYRFVREGGYTENTSNYYFYESTLPRGLNSYTFSLNPQEEQVMGSNNLNNTEGTCIEYKLRDGVVGDGIFIISYYQLVRIASGFAVPMW